MNEPIQRILHLRSGLFERMGALHFSDDVVLFEHDAFPYNEDRLFSFSYAVLAHVDSGEADIVVGGRTIHTVSRDELILLPDQNVGVSRLSRDFHARFVLLSHDFVSYITTEDSYLFIQMVRNNPLIHLGEPDTNAFHCCYELLHAALLQRDNPYLRQTLYHIIKAYIYGAMYYVKPDAPVIKSREEELTYRFMELVDNHFRTEHALAFYADHMHLTAKYISRCVLIATGRSGIKIIADRIIQQAKVMLLARQKTIAQIGFELGFADQSSFGKFFSKHAGMSPQKWRSIH